MTLPTVSLSRDVCDERLRAALLDITTHPEKWAQDVWGITNALPSVFTENVSSGTWPCETTCCLAGNIAIREKMVVGTRDPATGSTVLEITEQGVQLIESERTGLQWNPGEHDFAGLGAALLGLPRIQAVFLFKSDLSLRDLWDVAGHYTENRVQLPEELRETVARIDEQWAANRDPDAITA